MTTTTTTTTTTKAINFADFAANYFDTTLGNFDINFLYSIGINDSVPFKDMNVKGIKVTDALSFFGLISALWVINPQMKATMFNYHNDERTDEILFNWTAPNGCQISFMLPQNVDVFNN